MTKFYLAIIACFIASTLKQWWLDGDESPDYTSVSFLLDRDGVIRYIHPGGQYVEGDGDYEEVEAYIRTLLDEKK